MSFDDYDLITPVALGAADGEVRRVAHYCCVTLVTVALMAQRRRRRRGASQINLRRSCRRL